MSEVAEQSPEITEEVTAPLAETSAMEAEVTETIQTAAAAATAFRERLALHGQALGEDVSLADVPDTVLEALMHALPPEAVARPTDEKLREQLAARISGSERLPRGVRERLAHLLGGLRFDARGHDEPALRVSDAVALLEEALPPHLLLSPDEVTSLAHPRGDSFYTGDPRSLSTDEARQIAARQLAGSGFARR